MSPFLNSLKTPFFSSCLIRHFVSSVATSNFLRVHLGISHTKLNKGGPFAVMPAPTTAAEGADERHVVPEAQLPGALGGILLQDVHAVVFSSRRFRAPRISASYLSYGRLALRDWGGRCLFLALFVVAFSELDQQTDDR